MTMESTSIFIPKKDGTKLAAVVHGPIQQNMVVCCHGMLSDKNSKKYLETAQILAKKDISTVRFDFTGCGESSGTLFELSYSREMEDLDAVIEYLWTQGAKRIGLFGSSMGGAVALLAAARDERVVAIATLAAVGHPEEIEGRYPEHVDAWKTRGFVETDGKRIGPELYRDSLQHDVINAVRILRIPIFVTHGSIDDVVPVADAYDIAEAARNVSLEIVDGADHRFTNPVHLRGTLRLIADFLAQKIATNA